MSHQHGRRRWEDLRPWERVLAVVLGVVQVGLALVAWADLAQRPAALVRGRKAAWAAVIAVNYVGPVLYLTRGRMPARMP